MDKKIIELKEEIDKRIMEDVQIQMITDLTKESQLLTTLEESVIELKNIGMDKITLDTDFVLNLIQQNQEYIDLLVEQFFENRDL